MAPPLPSEALAVPSNETVMLDIALPQCSSALAMKTSHAARAALAILLALGMRPPRGETRRILARGASAGNANIRHPGRHPRARPPRTGRFLLRAGLLYSLVTDH